MNKIEIMKLVKESNLNKYEKLLLLDFIVSEPEESIPFILDEFQLTDIGRALKSGGKKVKEVGKKVGKKAGDIYYKTGVAMTTNPIVSRLAQYPPAIFDPTPGSGLRNPQVQSDIGAGISWAKKKMSKK